MMGPEPAVRSQWQAQAFALPNSRFDFSFFIHFLKIWVRDSPSQWDKCIASDLEASRANRRVAGKQNPHGSYWSVRQSPYSALPADPLTVSLILQKLWGDLSSWSPRLGLRTDGHLLFSRPAGGLLPVFPPAAALAQILSILLSATKAS